MENNWGGGTLVDIIMVRQGLRGKQPSNEAWTTREPATQGARVREFRKGGHTRGEGLLGGKMCCIFMNPKKDSMAVAE